MCKYPGAKREAIHLDPATPCIWHCAHCVHYTVYTIQYTQHLLTSQCTLYSVQTSQGTGLVKSYYPDYINFPVLNLSYNGVDVRYLNIYFTDAEALLMSSQQSIRMINDLDEQGGHPWSLEFPSMCLVLHTNLP